MVKREFRKRPYPLKANRKPRKVYSKIKRMAYKKPYSKGVKSRSYLKVGQKSLKHVMDVGGQGLVKDEKEMVEKIALKSMMDKSAKTFNVNITDNIIALGTLGTKSIGTSIISALTDKHVHLTSGISINPTSDVAYQLVKPDIQIRGISFRRNGFVEAGGMGNRDIIDFTSVPICQYQFTDTTPLNFFTFNAGKCYIKIPKVVNGDKITYPMPKHLNFFNCWAGRVKVYYRIGHKTGFAGVTAERKLSVEPYEINLRSFPGMET